MKKLQVGIIGCGFVAQEKHIPAFLKLKDKVALTAVCDLNKKNTEGIAKKFKIPAYSSFSDMLSKENLDAVDICTPPHVHAQLAIEAMKQGSHVLLEKPMALKVSDCDDMIHAAQKYGTKLCVVHNQRFRPIYLKAQELVEKGAIGKLTGMRNLHLTPSYVYMANENSWIHKLPGGVISETGPHDVYTSLIFLKKIKNVSVHAKKTLDYPWVLYDDYRIELEGEKINSSLLISHANDTTSNEVDLLGSEGAIRVDLQSMLLIYYKRRNVKPLSLVFSSLGNATQTVKGITLNAFAFLFRKTFLGHDVLIKKFVNSLINNQAVPVPGEEGRETIRVMEMIVKKLDQK
ncbi:MAG: Gfo/Idh/MocA family protein [Promethearchaeota archaeon]